MVLLHLDERNIVPDLTLELASSTQLARFSWKLGEIDLRIVACFDDVFGQNLIDPLQDRFLSWALALAKVELLH
jgi:hypothetical protein